MSLATVDHPLPPVLTSRERWDERFGVGNRRTPDVYVNAYELELGFGGREEGGWWYDIGTPIASVPVASFGAARIVFARLRDHFAERYEGRGRHSAAPEPDLSIVIEDRVAASFPTERPRYE